MPPGLLRNKNEPSRRLRMVRSSFQADATKSECMKRSGRSRGDEQERFKSLTLPHLDALLRLATQRLGDPDLAIDLVQDTYLRAW